MTVGEENGDANRRAPLVSALHREETLANRVVVELERLIVDSRLGEGDRLPSERELAAQFGVSRTVVREAVRALAAKRLVEVEGGRGTVVRAPSTRAAAESMGLLLRVQESAMDADKVAEVRRVLENEIAKLAASRRTAEDLKVLEGLLDAAEVHAEQPDSFIVEDVEFHAALARATHNELFSVLLESLAQMMLEVRLLALRHPGHASPEPGAPPSRVRGSGRRRPDRRPGRHEPAHGRGPRDAPTCCLGRPGRLIGPTGEPRRLPAQPSRRRATTPLTLADPPP